MPKHCFHLDNPLFISWVSVADFEHEFVCWERCRKTTVVMRILEMPYPANIY